MRYLTPQEILIIHDLVINETGGSHGVRDIGLLISACKRPKTAVFGTEQFPSIHEKASVYLDSIARNHVFIDGNKRTAFVATARFLAINGLDINATNREIELFVIKVATKHLEVREIAKWIKKKIIKIT